MLQDQRVRDFRNMNSLETNFVHGAHLATMEATFRDLEEPVWMTGLSPFNVKKQVYDHFGRLKNRHKPVFQFLCLETKTFSLSPDEHFRQGHKHTPKSRGLLKSPTLGTPTL